MTIRERVEIELEKARPHLAKDGGGIEYVGFEERTDTLELRMLGACRTCPLISMTFRGAIERLIVANVPEIRRIEQVE
jgi:Fe-S cluster biogenesis protein NfuA